MRPHRLAAAILTTTLAVAGCGNDPNTNQATEGSNQDDPAHEQPEDSLEEVDEPAYRLLVADAREGRISIVELTTGETIDTLDIAPPEEAPTRFATSTDGRYGFAGLYDRDDVEVIDGASRGVSHGDHAHYYAGAPEVLTALPGGTPAHIVPHGDHTAIFYDDDGNYRLISGTDLVAGEEGELIAADAPHHGVAVPWSADRTIVTSYGNQDPAESTLPAEVVVHDGTGKTVEDGFPACPELHGEAATEQVVAFACEDGILVLESHDDHFDGQKLDYPDGRSRSGTLLAVPGRETLVGDYTDGAVLVIDPIEHKATPLAIPESLAALTVNAYDGGSLLGVTPDGTIHRIGIDTGETTSIPTTATEFDPAAEWTDPTPQLSATADTAFVSDPAAGSVYEVDLATAEVTRTLDVAGEPFHLAVLGPR